MGLKHLLNKEINVRYPPNHPCQFHAVCEYESQCMQTHGYTETQNREKLRKAKRHVPEGMLNHNIELIKAMTM